MRVSSLASLALATLAAAAPKSAYKYQNTFTLISEVFKGAPGVNVVNNVLTGYHVGAGVSVGVLVPANASSQPNNGAVFYQNSTHNRAYSRIWYYGGDGIPFFFGVTKPAYADSRGRREISLGVTDTDSFGFAIDWIQTPAETYKVPYLSYKPQNGEPGPGAFYSCRTDNPYGYKNITELYWRNETSTTPADCAEVRLYPQCAGKGQGPSRQFNITSKPSACFPSVEKWETGTD